MSNTEQKQSFLRKEILESDEADTEEFMAYLEKSRESGLIKINDLGLDLDNWSLQSLEDAVYSFKKEHCTGEISLEEDPLNQPQQKNLLGVPQPAQAHQTTPNLSQCSQSDEEKTNSAEQDQEVNEKGDDSMSEQDSLKWTHMDKCIDTQLPELKDELEDNKLRILISQ